MHQTIVVGSFLCFLVLFTLIGALSAREKQTTSEDYLLASRSVNPWLTALSAVSTNNSGYMFIGLIGYAWRSGIEAMWITFGWIAGDLVTWFWVHSRVRRQSEEVNANSVPALLATDPKKGVQRPISVMAGLLTLFFLGGYAAAQLKAGSTTLHVLFGWPYWLGAVIGVVVVVIYCFAGGIRASIWTDSAQAVVMIVAMSVLVGACWMKVGGPAELLAQMGEIDPQLVQTIPDGLTFGLIGYVMGFLFAGAGTVGQPHILIRFMAIDEVDSIKKARVIYFIWYTAFSAAALAVGLYARVLLPGLGGDNSEKALPMLASELLPAVLIGLTLAGIFSATMSTADSQILSCSAAITQDIAPQYRESYSASKVATLAVAVLALVIALVAKEGVFALVLGAWGALAATLGPLLLVRLAGKPLPDWLALSMMTLGLGVVFWWGGSEYADAMYKAMPGMLAPLLLYLAADKLGMISEGQDPSSGNPEE